MSPLPDMNVPDTPAGGVDVAALPLGQGADLSGLSGPDSLSGLPGDAGDEAELDMTAPPDRRPPELLRPEEPPGVEQATAAGAAAMDEAVEFAGETNSVHEMPDEPRHAGSLAMDSAVEITGDEAATGPSETYADEDAATTDAGSEAGRDPAQEAASGGGEPPNDETPPGGTAEGPGDGGDGGEPGDGRQTAETAETGERRNVAGQRRKAVTALAAALDDMNVDILDQVPPGHARAVIERYLTTGESNKEIAQALGISGPAVSLQFRRAVDSLLERYPNLTHTVEEPRGRIIGEERQGVGPDLNRLRKEQDVTVTELAEASGLPERTVQAFLSGDTRPSDKRAGAIMAALGMDENSRQRELGRLADERQAAIDQGLETRRERDAERGPSPPLSQSEKDRRWLSRVDRLLTERIGINLGDVIPESAPVLRRLGAALFDPSITSAQLERDYGVNASSVPQLRARAAAIVRRQLSRVSLPADFPDIGLKTYRKYHRATNRE